MQRPNNNFKSEKNLNFTPSALKFICLRSFHLLLPDFHLITFSLSKSMKCWWKKMKKTKKTSPFFAFSERNNKNNKKLKVSALTASTAGAVIQQYDNNGKVFYTISQADFKRCDKINPQVHFVISCHHRQIIIIITLLRITFTPHMHVHEHTGKRCVSFL